VRGDWIEMDVRCTESVSDLHIKLQETPFPSRPLDEPDKLGFMDPHLTARVFKAVKVNLHMILMIDIQTQKY